MYKMYLLHHRQPFFCGCGCSITLEFLEKHKKYIFSLVRQKTSTKPQRIGATRVVYAVPHRVGYS